MCVLTQEVKLDMDQFLRSEKTRDSRKKKSREESVAAAKGTKIPSEHSVKDDKKDASEKERQIKVLREKERERE